MQKRTWSTLYRVKTDLWARQATKAKTPVDCHGAVRLLWHAAYFDLFLWHWQHHKLSHPCNSTLWTYQLAAMEQFEIWQGRTCMFHTMFFISYKTSGRARGNVRLDGEAFCASALLWLVKIQHNKRNWKRQREKCSRSSLLAHCVCGAHMAQRELSSLDIGLPNRKTNPELSRLDVRSNPCNSKNIKPINPSFWLWGNTGISRDKAHVLHLFTFIYQIPSVASCH